MTVTQLRAARKYTRGELDIDGVRRELHCSLAQALRVLGAYARAHIAEDPQCAACPWRCGGRPCVWPRGMCALEREVGKCHPTG